MYPYPYQPSLFDTDYYRQQNQANRIFNIFREQHSELVSEMQNAGMDQETITYIIWTVIQYTIATSTQVTGSLNERTNHIYENMLNQINWLPYLFKAYRLSSNQMKRIVRTMIRLTLQHL